MLKFLHTRVCAFDVEWVPDPDAGRRRYHLSVEMPDADVVAEMYRRDRAYHERANPRPYLKTPLCRVVSIAIARWHRARKPGIVQVSAWAGPMEPDIIAWFFDSIADKPQLFSYNGQRADIPILLQRAALHRLPLERFMARPAKPWEGRDYFDRYSGWHVDLLDSAIGGGSLNDLCAGLDIPGKGVVDGGSVADLWAAGQVAAVCHYNEADAMRVLAVVGRLAQMAGLAEIGDVPWADDVLERHPEWGGAS